jgi:hypothetical protein
MRSRGFSFWTSIVASAPKARAISSLRASASSPVTMIRSAPASRHASTLASPRWPGPMMTTVSPGPVLGISTAQRKPAPSGLNMTAVSGGSVGSILCTTAFGSRYMYWE